MSMSELKLGQMRIPDILETIADLSNDEVFTPPDLANKVLDMLPEEIWKNSKATFLDPACKTGVFLREITKRLIVGLEGEIPDLQERVNHILTKQVYGLAITELTALMSRRTVYCATKANSGASVVTAFDNADGHIKFPKSKHNFHEKTKKCTICGAGEDLYHEIENRDNYAYSFLHDNLKEVFGDVKFDVIIGNPPYQLSVSGEENEIFNAAAIYHLFVERAYQLNPKYVSMIMPSRWMNGAARGIPEEWTNTMLKDKQIKIIHDFEDSLELFPNVGVSGGICYFLWEKDYKDGTSFTFHNKFGETSERTGLLDDFNIGSVIRDSNMHSIIKKILKKEGKKMLESEELNFTGYVSPKNYFTEGKYLTSNWREYSLTKTKENNILYYISKAAFNETSLAYIKESDIKRNKEALDLHKIYISAAYGDPIRYDSIISVPRYGEPKSVCSQTYLVVGYKHNLTKEQCFNIMSYMQTRLFRFLVRAKKTTQNGSRNVYQFVPLQDFNKKWTDIELYRKYSLTKEEIAYIEKTIPEMNIPELD